MRRFKQLKMVAAGSLVIVDGEFKAKAEVTIVDNLMVNGFLAEGWELVEIITHHTPTGTAIAYVLGLPQEEGGDKN